MIVGLGIDIVSVARVSKRIENRSFVEKVFSEGEIEYCEKSASKQQYYAARFAAKEAFLKATGQGLTLSYDLKDIEVQKLESEKPLIVLTGVFKEMQVKEGWKAIHVSLSHEGDTAAAVVIIEK